MNDKSAQDAIELEAKDLPAYCPNPRMPLWSGHPRVYLDLAHGEASCPYCGTRYRLAPGTVVAGH
ncbi:MAG: zinc-finger domain-containing protein [Burkholderiaceae bacterium]|nr:zinc-finger domain-containing protein [Burkholderiaceae bacterium]